MGAFKGFGDFLNGYVTARAQKHQQKLQENGALMDEAMSWAKVADTTQNDSIREMATKNIQDRMLKHEKSMGEKNGIGAIIKLLHHDKKDSPSVLSTLAKGAAQPVPTYSQEVPKTIDTSAADQAQTVRDAGAMQAVNPPAEAGTQLDYRPEEAVNLPEQKSLSDIATPQQDTSPNMASQGWKQEPPSAQAIGHGVDRAQALIGKVAPGKEVFLPRYGGGTRFSPTNEEKADFDLKMKERESKVSSDAAFENNKRMYAWQKEQKDAEDKRNLDKLHQTSLYINSTPDMREQMDFQTTTHTTMPQVPPDWNKPVGGTTFEGDKVMAKNAYGKPIEITDQFREKNKYAAMDYDATPAGQRDWATSVKNAGSVEKAIVETEKKVKESQAFEQNARGSYYKQMPAIEKAKIKETRDRINHSNQGQTRLVLKELDEKKWPNEARSLVPDIELPMGQMPPESELEAAVTGKDHNGKPVIDSSGTPKRPKINPDTGKPFTSLSQYKDWWYTKQLGKGPDGSEVDLNSVRYFASTGVNPWKDLDTTDEEGISPKEPTKGAPARNPAGRAGATPTERAVSKKLGI